MGIFTAVWDPAGATGTFDALEFAAAYYAVALPLCAAGLSGDHKIARGLAGAGLVLGGAHLALSATSWLIPALMAAALALPAVALARRAGPTAAGLPALIGAGLIVLAGALGPAALAPEPEPTNPATSLPWVTRIESNLYEDNVRRGQPTDPRFAIERIETVRQPEARDYLGQVTRTFLEQDLSPIGEGAGGWWLHQTRHVLPDHEFMQGRFDRYPAFRSPHNGYAKLLIEQGIVGLILWALWGLGLLVLIWRAAGAAPEAEDDPEARAQRAWIWGTSAAVLSALLVMSQTALLELAAPVLVLFVSAGALARSAHEHLGQGGWGTSWRAESSVFGWALAAVSLGAAVLTLGAFDTTSRFFQGRADQLMFHGHFKEARADYLRAHEIFPARGELLYNHALASWRLGDTQPQMLVEILEELKRAQSMRPEDARILHLRGVLHLKRRELSKATELSRAAIRRFPTYIDAYKNAAIAQNLSMNFDGATDTLEEAIALEPPAKVRVGLHESAGQIFEGPSTNPAKALEHYQAALELASTEMLRARLRGRAVEMKKRVERERLARENKPIPPELMPTKKHHNHAGEALGLPGAHDGHGHGPSKGGGPTVPPGSVSPDSLPMPMPGGAQPPGGGGGGAPSAP